MREALAVALLALLALAACGVEEATPAPAVEARLATCPSGQSMSPHGACALERNVTLSGMDVPVPPLDELRGGS
jgi:hypothetical protein